MLKYIEGNPFIQRVSDTILFLDAQKESTFSSRTLLHLKRKFMRGSGYKRTRMENMFDSPHLYDSQPIITSDANSDESSGLAPFTNTRRTAAIRGRNIDEVLERFKLGGMDKIDQSIYDMIRKEVPSVEPLNIPQDGTEMLDYAIEREVVPTFRQRVIVERRSRNLLKSWGVPIKLADVYSPY